MTEEAPRKGSGDLPTFEEAFTGLEETVQAMEAGSLTLTEATSLYEEGMRLARVCNELLSATELRITRLQSSFGEQMRFLADKRPDAKAAGPRGRVGAPEEELFPEETPLPER